MLNYKDTATEVCAAVVGLAAATKGADSIWPAVIPVWILVTMYIAGSAATIYGLHLIGKNPDGTSKTPEQIATLSNVMNGVSNGANQQADVSQVPANTNPPRIRA
jgi:hypothetical protein